MISAQELWTFGYPTILEALRGVRGFAVNFDNLFNWQYALPAARTRPTSCRRTADLLIFSLTATR